MVRKHSSLKTRMPTTMISFAFRVRKRWEDYFCLAASSRPVASPGASLGARGRKLSAIMYPAPLHLSCCPQLSATFTIPIWQWFLTRFGKKTAVYVGISVSGAQRVELSWGVCGGGRVADGSLLGDLSSCTLCSSLQFLFSSWWPSWRVI